MLLVHPGTQYAPHLARELASRGQLHRFWTGFAIAESGVLSCLVALAPASLRSRLSGRRVGIPSSQLRTLPNLDWKARRVARRQGDEAAFSERNQRFQEAVPEAELRAASVVVGYDTSSWILIRRAQALGKRFILDQSIGHPVAKERVFEMVRQRFPDWSSSVPKKSAEMLAVEREEHERADLIVVPSEFVKQTLVSEGVEAAKIRIIPFGTDLEVFHPPEIPRHHRKSPCVFLFAGSISARKGVPELLRAWAEVALPDAELWLAGPGTIPASDQRFLTQNAKILGRLNRSQLAETLRRADVFVLPSHFEGLAQVQIEAQCAGLPVIGTLESGASELVTEGENGFLIPAGDVAALAGRMTRLPTAPELRRSMSQSAIACREQRSWKVYGDRWAAVLAEL